MQQDTLELSELLDEANRLRASIPELAETDPFTERTVYYYIQRGLLPRASRRRGPGTTYPASFVDRLLFIRRLQKEPAITLAHIREVMAQVPIEIIRRVARGEEPLELRYSASVEPDDLEKHSQIIPLTMQDTKALKPRRSVMFSLKGGAPPPMPSNRKAEFPSAPRDERDSETPPGGARQYRVGEHAVLYVNCELTRLQEDRLRHMIDLLRSILEEGE